MEPLNHPYDIDRSNRQQKRLLSPADLDARGDAVGEVLVIGTSLLTPVCRLLGPNQHTGFDRGPLWGWD